MRQAAIIFGLWTIHGLFMASVTYYRYSFSRSPLAPWQAMALEMSYSYMWALLTPFVLWFSRKLPLDQKRWWLSLLAHAACAVALTIVSINLWQHGPQTWVKPPTKPARDLYAAVRFGLLNIESGVIQYCFILLCQHAARYYRRYEEGLTRSSQLEAQLARAQFQALRMQLNPHFLFNTLNTISELVHTEPQKAERMVIRLSDFLRLTLQSQGTSEIPLAQEVAFLERYLEIERIRFQERMQIQMDLAPETLQAAVPHFVLQPLVENAIHHGLFDKPESARLAIASAREGSRLTIRILDNGPGVVSENGHRPETPRIDEGLGIGNTRQRLEKLYGSDQNIAFKNVSDGFLVTISIPFRLTEDLWERVR